MILTVEDLFRFETALRAGKIISHEMVMQYLEPRTDISTDFYFRYGYGWRHQRDTGGEPVIWHSYSGDYSAQLVRFEGADLLVIKIQQDGVLEMITGTPAGKADHYFDSDFAGTN